MARTVKRKDGTTRREGCRRRREAGPAFVELVSAPPREELVEDVLEVVLVSGRRLLVREGIDASRLRQLVAALEDGCSR